MNQHRRDRNREIVGQRLDNVAEGYGLLDAHEIFNNERKNLPNGNSLENNVATLTESQKNGTINLNRPIRIKFSPTGLHLSKKEFAKFHSSVSTDYYMSYKTHEGLQYQSCVTDTDHMLYIYEDGGFGNYKVVAKMDFSDTDLVNTVVEELKNGKTNRITDFVDRVIKTNEFRRRSYTVYNSSTKKRSSSRGDGFVYDGQSESYTERFDASSGRFSGDSGRTGGNLAKIKGRQSLATESSVSELYNDSVPDEALAENKNPPA